MIYRAVADALFFHAAYYLLECVEVLQRVAVKLDIADVTAVGERVIGRFQLYLAVCADVVIYRNVERVGVVIAVGDAGYLTVLLLVNADESAGKSLGRGSKQAEIKVSLFAFVVHALSHAGDDVKTELLRFWGFTVMHADERFQAFCQTDEAHRKSAVLENFGDAVVLGKLLGIYPHALTHQEREVPYMLAALYLEAEHQLVHNQVHHIVQGSVELVQVAVRLDSKTGQVDGCEAEVAPAGDDLAGRVVNIADNSCAAAHVSGLGVVISGLVVLQIERRVDEREVREHALCRNADSQLEQVVVGILGVVVYAFLDLENVYREYRRLTVAETVFLGEHDVLDDHSALGGGVGSVVYRGERVLRAGSGIHRVEVVDKRFHRLVGRTVGFSFRELFGSVLQVGEVLAVLSGYLFPFLGFVVVVVLQSGAETGFIVYLRGDLFHLLKNIGEIVDAQ